ncbi:GNAT family N-acetyltransferase [Pseudonocardia alni]|uniref:GNAT family N-acetyltransferase n=1 Tax=Pseudonocardia alni TaxID=33907 RepID=UPI001AD6BAA2|nr:GNAT family N-acetyltransferase [Pseudonocardia alni]MBO4240021.1 GNAT family N-acetyltransferase [Pseudonocardia alni]
MTAPHPVPPAASALELRWVDHTDPLVRPLLTGPGTRPDGDGDGADPVAPSGPVVLLLDGGDPVAGGTFRRWDSDTAELTRIWTAASHRRRGLGRRVLVELEDAAAARGYRRVYLTAGPHRSEVGDLCLAAGYTALYDRALPACRVRRRPFEKYLHGRFA